MVLRRIRHSLQRLPGAHRSVDRGNGPIIRQILQELRWFETSQRPFYSTRTQDCNRLVAESLHDGFSPLFVLARGSFQVTFEF